MSWIDVRRRELSYHRVMSLVRDVEWWTDWENSYRRRYDMASGTLQEVYRKGIRSAKKRKKELLFELGEESDRLARLIFGEGYIL